MRFTTSPRLSLAASLTTLLAAALVALGEGCVPTMSNPREYAPQQISAEAGKEYFTHTGGGDPYATGMSYPVFLALMELYPNELGKDWNEFEEKFGFLPPPEAKGDPSVVPIGFHVTTDPNSEVPWLVGNCTMCHTGRVHLESGDIYVTGMGNVAARPHAYAAALVRIAEDPRLTTEHLAPVAKRRARAWKVPWNDRLAPYILSATIDGLKLFAKKRKQGAMRFQDALPGRTATIEAFAIALNDYNPQHPIPLPEATGWAKIPDVRGFPFKDTFSWDASGYGSPQALVLEADFLFGVRPEWYLSHPHIATSTYLYLKSFSRRTPYPKQVDAELAAKGKGSFELHCSHCHGFYVDHGDEMRVSYKERVVPQEVVGTDPAREEAVTPEFVKAANDFPLTKGYTAVRHTGGYVPPVLLDVWARGVYGHVGQWPSLEVVATPPSERPKQFIVDPKGYYDLDRVGVRYEAVPAGTSPRALKPGEYVYDGTKTSYHVEGHPFLANLPPDEKRAVIEYLKTL